MPPSASPSSSAPPRPSLPKQEDDTVMLKELRTIGVKAAVITILSCFYGQMTVAQVLPRDPRQDPWLVMWSPYPVLAVTLLYLAVVTWWAPRYMHSRGPIQGLRPVMMAYNAFQVVFSFWIFWEAGMGGWFGSYSFVCQTCDYSQRPMAIRMMHCAYWYHFSKYVDFADTVFFVLNKKYEHLSLLHLVHHGLMPVSTWYGVRYHPGGQNTFFGLLNSFVHVVMYLYYLLAAMGPRVRPYLWWKKYLTTLQLIQFTLVFFHAFQPLVVECDVPPVLMNWVGFVSVMFFYLFADFYIKAYRKKVKTSGQRGITEISGYANSYKNGFQNGHINCYNNGDISELQNGYTNGDLNGYKNGDVNRIKNGGINGVANGTSRSINDSIPHLAQDTQGTAIRSRV